MGCINEEGLRRLISQHIWGCQFRIEIAASALRQAGRNQIEINASGTTSSHVMSALASAGSTQVEPGYGLTWTTSLHAVIDKSEAPAILYLSKISHTYNGRPYCFGGGLYIDPVFPPYDVQALAGSDPDTAFKHPVHATLPPPSAIDYYGILEPDDKVSPGDSVIFGFRAQAFFTRAYIVPVSGISQSTPRVEGIWNSTGQKVNG